MKLKSVSLFLFFLSLAGGSPAVLAESATSYPDSGPETTLDSIWAGTGYLNTLTDTVASQITQSRLQDETSSRFWASGLASFGNASVRNDHPSFDYSAGGLAIGYDYCKVFGKEVSGLLGVGFGQMFGHQNIDEMPDYPEGPISGDRFRQSAFGADIYGAVLKELTPRSHLIFSLDAAVGYMVNECRHSDVWTDMPEWNTETIYISYSTAWRYEVTDSFSLTPFAKLSYTHSNNKKERDDYCYEDYDNDGYYDTRWDTRGRFDNLALDVGLTLEHTLRFSHDTAWINSVTGSYCPDIVRNNPHYTFDDSWSEGGEIYQSRYRGQGYPASRQAFKVRFQSRLVCSENLSFFASYQASLRESYTEHQAALGATFSF